MNHLFLFREGLRRWWKKLWRQVMTGMLRRCEFLCLNGVFLIGVCMGNGLLLVLGVLNLCFVDLNHLMGVIGLICICMIIW
jgi:hypothetical protein